LTVTVLPPWPAAFRCTPKTSACESALSLVLRTRTLYCPDVPVTVHTSMPWGEAACVVAACGGAACVGAVCEGAACPDVAAALASSAANGRIRRRVDREGTARSG